jgi:MoxR-like ATPase
MTVCELGEYLNGEMRKVVAGQEDVIEQVLVCLLSGGHVLLEGVPGIAKTLIAKTLAHVLGCEFKRIQFTPDLMPTDVVGTYVYDSKASEFRLKKGPVFTSVLLADEINRTPPRTQSALLEAMEEKQVSIDGIKHVLDGVFFVAATQNPIEYEGTYPLPEAQLDRFLMKLIVDYPGESDEMVVVQRSHEGFNPHDLASAGLKPLEDLQPIMDAFVEVQKVTADEDVIRYAATIARQTRGAYRVILGASPRASVALLKCGKALAALRGRDYVTPDDIKSLALPILRHRLILSPECAIEGVKTDEVIAGILASVPVPR